MKPLIAVLLAILVLGPARAADAPPAAQRPALAGQDLDGLHGGMRRTPQLTDTKVPKASGSNARTIQEIHGGKVALKDKPVTVRGRIVKFTPNVMGKNWVHLRDGSGSAADKSNDLLVTTLSSAQVGKIVIAKGTLRTDVELGHGYSYKVLLDNATLGD